jgi:hypothetical protein
VYSYGSDDDANPPSGGQGGSRYIPLVGGGHVEGTSSASFTGRFREAKGNRAFHALDCRIDPNNLIPETNEQNNRKSAWINRGAGT